MRRYRRAEETETPHSRAASLTVKIRGERFAVSPGEPREKVTPLLIHPSGTLGNICRFLSVRPIRPLGVDGTDGLENRGVGVGLEGKESLSLNPAHPPHPRHGKYGPDGQDAQSGPVRPINENAPDAEACGAFGVLGGYGFRIAIMPAASISTPSSRRYLMPS